MSNHVVCRDARVLFSLNEWEYERLAEWLKKRIRSEETEYRGTFWGGRIYLVRLPGTGVQCKSLICYLAESCEEMRISWMENGELLHLRMMPPEGIDIETGLPKEKVLEELKAIMPKMNFEIFTNEQKGIIIYGTEGKNGPEV